MNHRPRMNRKLWGRTVVALLLIVLSWCYLSRNTCNSLMNQIGVIEVLVREVATDENNTVNIEPVTIQKEGVEASYPRLTSGGSPASLERWNQIIKQDFDKILQIYSFQPYLGPTPSSTDVVPIVLRITYEVKGNTADWFSILYRADFNSSYSAHPSNLIYTTNIDKRRDLRLRLRDIVILDEAFVKDFRTWKRTNTTEDTPELQKAIHDYVSNITDEELLTGFQAADQIGSNNPWGIYSYLTKDSLGISIELPNYAGDHAEFEQSLAELENKGLLNKGLLNKGTE